MDKDIDETCIGFWDEDCEFVFKQAISNLNLEDKIHILKPAYYKNGEKAEGRIALTHTQDMNCSKFWDEVSNVCRQDKETICRFVEKIPDIINYRFFHNSDVDCKIAWREVTDREVIAFLELGCAKIELVIERVTDNNVVLSTFCSCNFEGIGWKNDGYASVGVQDKVSEFTSRKQVEQYMKKELIEYCDKNNIDYTKDALDEKYAWWNN